MYLTRLSLTNYRIFSRLELDFPRRVILFTGDNAQGKTSILEAVAYLANLSSFSASNDRQLMNFSAPLEPIMVARILGEFERAGRHHTIEVRLIQDDASNPATPRFSKQVLLDGVKKRLGDIYGQFNAVTFLPQMSRIIEGAPAERRQYFDEILSQVEPGYARHLSAYSKALSQRNALLKTLAEIGGDKAQLEPWDDLLARHGASIMHARILALATLEKQAIPIHQRLTRDIEILQFHYQPSYEPLKKPSGQMTLPVHTALDRTGINSDELERGLLAAYKQSTHTDIQRGQTCLGPHRDEVRFLSNQIDLGDYGSRGQARTTLLTLKFAEVAWMKQRTGEWPVLLLDEIMAELDPQRRKDLLSVVGQVEQAFVTATDLEMFTPEFVREHEVWQVDQGIVTRS
jgi:DNA replication and repair protein RecF